MIVFPRNNIPERTNPGRGYSQQNYRPSENNYHSQAPQYHRNDHPNYRQQPNTHFVHNASPHHHNHHQQQHHSQHHQSQQHHSSHSHNSQNQHQNRPREPVVDVTGRVVTLARTQNGSRQVQNAIAQGTNKAREQIFEEILPSLVSLMTDVFGNYVIQVLVDHASDEQLSIIVTALNGQIIHLSEDLKSNYVIQKIIENAAKVAAKTDQGELKDRLLTFMNHTVLEIFNKLVELSCHQSGNRIIQSVLKFFPDAIKESILVGLMNSFNVLVKNSYGTYVLQEAINLKNFQLQIHDVIELAFLDLSLDNYGSLFIDHYLTVADSKKLERLISRIFSQPKILIELLNLHATSGAATTTPVPPAAPSGNVSGTTHGHAFNNLKKMIELSDIQHLNEFKFLLNETREVLLQTFYGHDFINRLQKQYEKLILKQSQSIAKLPSTDIHPVAKQIIDQLQLLPHPEGGHYRETWRGEPSVANQGRAIGTLIHFLLAKGEVSHWHRVDATEVWFYHAGDPLKLSIVQQNGHSEEIILGGDVLAGQKPHGIVPKDAWQAAEPLGNYTLVSCTVTPGFQFEGFTLAPPGFNPKKSHSHSSK